jgi:hypothetical protein
MRFSLFFSDESTGHASHGPRNGGCSPSPTPQPHGIVKACTCTREGEASLCLWGHRSFTATRSGLATVAAGSWFQNPARGSGVCNGHNLFLWSDSFDFPNWVQSVQNFLSLVSIGLCSLFLNGLVVLLYIQLALFGETYSLPIHVDWTGKWIYFPYQPLPIITDWTRLLCSWIQYCDAKFELSMCYALFGDCRIVLVFIDWDAIILHCDS